MSKKAPSAISQGVLGILRAGVTYVALDKRNSAVEQDGKPPPIAPQVYVAVTDAAMTTKGSRDGKPQNYLERAWRFRVFISMRTGIYAADQVEAIYDRLVGGFDTLESQVINLLHDKQAVRVACVALLDANEEPFLYPPYFMGRGGTQVHDAGWSLEENTGEPGECVGWLVRELPFEGLDRIEYSSEIA